MQSKKKVDKAIDAIFWIGLSDPTSFIFRQRLYAFLYKVIKCCVFSFFLPLSFHVKKRKYFDQDCIGIITTVKLLTMLAGLILFSWLKMRVL